MKNQFKIGRGKENEIVVQDKECPILHAEINYDKGNWLLNNLVKDKSVFVNGKKIEGPKELGKNDKIKIGKETFYWSNYLYEGENQELYLKDIFSDLQYAVLEFSPLVFFLTLFNNLSDYIRHINTGGLT